MSLPQPAPFAPSIKYSDVFSTQPTITHLNITHLLCGHCTSSLTISEKTWMTLKVFLVKLLFSRKIHRTFIIDQILMNENIPTLSRINLQQQHDIAIQEETKQKRKSQRPLAINFKHPYAGMSTAVHRHHPHIGCVCSAVAIYSYGHGPNALCFP